MSFCHYFFVFIYLLFSGCAVHEQVDATLSQYVKQSKSQTGFGGGWTLDKPQVHWVTNLNPKGQGSLRKALDIDGPKIIKFQVAGKIHIEKLNIEKGLAIIDGSSAPQPGITIVGSIRIIRTAFIKISNLRIYDAGLEKRVDGIKITEGSHHIVIDHCSIVGHRDNSIDLGERIHHISISNCIVHSFAPHAHGINSGKKNDNHSFSIFRNLIAHHNGHYPRIGGNSENNLNSTKPKAIADIRNNVMYNYRKGAIKLMNKTFVNIVGNVFKTGPSTKPNAAIINLKDHSRVYFANNITPLQKHNKAIMQNSLERAKTPFDADAIPSLPAAQTLKTVLSNAGTAKRDSNEEAIVRSVHNGTGWQGLPPQDNFFPAVNQTASTVLKVKKILATTAAIPTTAWEMIAPIEQFVHHKDQEWDNDVDVRIACSNYGVHLRVVGEQEEVNAIAEKKRDLWPTDGHGRHVEFHMAPKWGKTPRFMFVITAEGVVFDAKNFEGLWNAKWHASSKFQGDEWETQFAIPWQVLEMNLDNFKGCGIQIVYYQNEDEERIFPSLKSQQAISRYLGPVTDFAMVHSIH